MRTIRHAWTLTALLATAACGSTTVSGQPSTDPSESTSTTTSATSSSEEPSPTTPASNDLPLDDVKACPLLDSTSLPASWQPMKSEADLTDFGASNCQVSQVGGTGLGITIVVFEGPGEGIDALSQTTASIPTPIDIAGRNARIYRDTAGNTCGVIFEFGPDQGILVGGSAAVGSSEDTCEIVTTAATAMVPNLPPA